MGFSISDIKKHLGPGLGLRKNKYMLELPVPTITGETINILCQSAGLPERNITSTEVWHKGRKYVMRGETDFINEYEISIVDDDEMKIRKLFDTWMKTVDNTRPNKNSSLLGASFEENNLDNITDVVTFANIAKNTLTDRNQSFDFVLGQINENVQLAGAAYQTDINIWQLNSTSMDNNADSDKVYGYKLQNAFPKQIGIVTLEDGDENTLSQFSVTFGFSEFVPLYGRNKDVINSVIGNQSVDVLNGINQFANF